MDLGRRFHRSPRRRVAAAVVGLLAVGADLALVLDGRGGAGPLRLSIAATAAVVLLLIARGDRATVGLTVVPVQGWRAWVRITAWIVALLGAAIGVVTIVAWTAGVLKAPPTLSPEHYGPRLVWSCVITPVFEEGVYRLALCVALVALCIGRIAVIAVCGVVFGLLHVAYGNPAPDNLLAGFVLGWAFLHSGSVLVPIALHALGNLLALSVQLATWYVQGR